MENTRASLSVRSATKFTRKIVKMANKAVFSHDGAYSRFERALFMGLTVIKRQRSNLVQLQQNWSNFRRIDF